MLKRMNSIGQNLRIPRLVNNGGTYTVDPNQSHWTGSGPVANGPAGPAPWPYLVSISGLYIDLAVLSSGAWGLDADPGGTNEENVTVGGPAMSTQLLPATVANEGGYPSTPWVTWNADDPFWNEGAIVVQTHHP